KEYDYDTLNFILEADIKCKEEGALLGSGLQVTDICFIQIDNDTGRETHKICAFNEEEWYFNSSWKLYTWDYVRWKWEGRTLTVALLVVRKDSVDAKGKIIKYNRANENPVAFYSTKYEDRKFSETGTGDDFSEMYFENP
ncbi:unnamed protein product, partial [Cylicocyclus nassatus]